MSGRRRHIAFALAVVTGVCASAASARAQPNLESRFPRHGFFVGAGFGPGTFKGSGSFDDLFGVGGDVTVRLGSSAGPRLLWLVQLDTLAYRAEDRNLADPKTNVHTVVSLAGQYYVHETMWLKTGFGPTSITQREKRGTEVETVSNGFGWMASGGLDLFRRGRFVIDIESTLAVGIYSDGTITQFGVKFAANWY